MNGDERRPIGRLTGALEDKYLLVIKCLVGLAVFSASVNAQPAVTQFYVSTGGNDASTGTVSSPWRTIQKAMTSASPGSTVNIRAGTYHERLTVKVSGTASAPIVFQPYGYTGLAADGTPGGASIANNGYKPCAGDQVILDYSTFGTVTDSVPFLSIVGKSYVTIQGLTFQNFNTSGPYQRGVVIDGGCVGVKILNNRFLNNKNLSASANGTTALLHFYVWRATNTLVQGNEFGWIVSARSEVCTMTTGSAGTQFIGNYLHDTDFIGLDVNSGSQNGIVRGNLLEYVSIKRDGTGYYKVGGSNSIYVCGGVNTTVERNLVRNSGFGVGALSEPGINPTKGVIIRNNVLYNNYTGIALGTWYSNTNGSALQSATVKNNTIYNNHIGLTIRPYVSSGVTIKNNILANNTNAISNSLNWPLGTIDYNLYYGNAAGPDVHRVTDDPQFISAASIPLDLNLKATSPAKNAGDPLFVPGNAEIDFAGNARVVDGRVDIGAYEVQPSVQAQAKITTNDNRRR